MPAVEGGSLVLEVSEVLETSDAGLIESIVEAAVEARAVLVTTPSLAVIEGPRGPLIASLGVGSLIFEPTRGDVTPPLLPRGLRVWRLRRREWIDGCRVEARGEVVALEGRGVDVEGVAIALGYKDPAALLLNGLRARHRLVPASVEGETILAEVRGHPLLGVVTGEGGSRVYVVHALEGEAARRLMYIAPLAGGCRRGLR